MVKKIIIIIILLLVFLVGFNPSLETKYYNDTSRQVSLISMSIASYREFLKEHPPLDRLYSIDGTCFFLVNSEELKGVEESGVVILSRGPIPGFLRETPVLNRTQGDINGAYHTYNETRTMLQDLAGRYPALAQVSVAGYSLEGRELNVIKISDHVNSDETEPNIFIAGCHHAREWISVEVPLLFARYLLEHYQDNAQVRRAVDGAQIYIMPIQNPDGLEFSIHTYRMWRKNRRYNGNLSWGVDTNRNYGYMWGINDVGSSPNSWSEVYRGPAPFSEPETAAVADFLLAHPPAGTISYHSHSQLIIYPWGYTYDPAPDAQRMNEIAAEMSNLIYLVNGRLYTYGAAETLYLTNGDTTDWVYGTFGTPAYTIELPPDEFVMGGFFTPEQMIDSAFSENLPALLYFVNYFADEDSTPAAPVSPPKSHYPRPRQ